MYLEFVTASHIIPSKEAAQMTSPKPKSDTFGKITDEGIQKLRARIGAPIPSRDKVGSIASWSEFANDHGITRIR